MPEQLKTFFDRSVVERIATMLRAAHPSFPRQRFLAEATEGLEAHELMGRARHIMRAMHSSLPADFEDAAGILLRSLGPERERAEGQGMDVFIYLPHTLYVAEHGLGHFETSMRAQYELTRRFTAEFSIRPFLERHPRETLVRLSQWAKDPNVHVRRLVSEGSRPRLPWASRLRAFQEDPRPVLELLELLKDDQELYVRRSVANNLNDIGKDHPDVLVDTCARWKEGASAERLWIIRHALRSAVKRGDTRALSVLGFSGGGALEVTASFPSKRVRIGENIAMTLSVTNRSETRQQAIVDLAVHFIKSNGKASPKVFKGGKVDLLPGASCTLEKTISFATMTTRKHYAGTHRVEALVNGRATDLGSFTVLG
ncbi:DNA alkylation repair enzyme [Cystobacter fuscus DSM 2262]|uniref:DNA alkylation repair enzyme n=1 Tax=Cystobacter fuscus (strain ATCC 25194 / DSM 2262 / NBRC 100088 / M29) TaxID=1242864 RepID=S9P7N5_CYSF2|nr:DNA alkylation repair protein [Cystobacter fuscus]EPX60460.1 DNA alkylation repair enzyme [Cystobacter fuscus DSM 2262]